MMQTNDAPFLAPVEHPRSLGMKIAYAMSRRMVGKVMTALKVLPPRLPTAFGMFYGKVNQLDRKLTLPHEMQAQIRLKVSGINGCEFCHDTARWYATKKLSMNPAKLDALDQYRTSSLFSDSERAALDYASELTTEKHVRRESFERLSRHFDEREICEIVWLVASEHLYNITNIGLNIHSDGLCSTAR